MLELDANPIPSIDGRPEITRGVALTAVAEAMYDDASWPELSRALSSAQRGSGAGLLALYDSYFGYDGEGTWGNELEAFQTIHCMDSAVRLRSRRTTPRPRCSTRWHRAGPAHNRRLLLHVLPRVGRSASEITGAGVGTILLCGATLDASTPLEGTRAMADTFDDSHLIVVDAVGTGCSTARSAPTT